MLPLRSFCCLEKVSTNSTSHWVGPLNNLGGNNSSNRLAQQRQKSKCSWVSSHGNNDSSGMPGSRKITEVPINPVGSVRSMGHRRQLGPVVLVGPVKPFAHVGPLIPVVPGSPVKLMGPAGLLGPLEHLVYGAMSLEFSWTSVSCHMWDHRVQWDLGLVRLLVQFDHWLIGPVRLIHW